MTQVQLTQFLNPSAMNFYTYSNANYLMTANNMAVGLNMPEALKSRVIDGNELSYGLPPYVPRCAFLVDEYPACPAHWMRSSGRIKSYFVPIKAGFGLWLDFNKSLSRVAQDVAVVVSAQGINAITGLPCQDAQLEQYLDKCPKHAENFGPDRFCRSCGYRWPKQNYLCSSGQPEGTLWLDGFRADDGVVRQYVITEEQVRSVAAAVVGADRVFALGISFFVSKSNRWHPAVNRLMDSSAYTKFTGKAILSNSSGFMPDPCAETELYEGPIASASGPMSYGTSVSVSNNPVSDSPQASAVLRSHEAYASKLTQCSLNSHKQGLTCADYVPKEVAVKKLEIAAGAKVDQRIYDDPNSLDYWQAEPTALIVINYVSEEDCEKILAAGKVDLSGSPEGFLQNIPVGN